MSKAEEAKLHIKVVINKEKTKVLFAEAGSDFTDVLLSFLLLPLGTIVDVLQKHYGDKAPVLGSLNSLYNGAANLDIIHFRDEPYKIQLLTPQEFQTQLCKLRINASRAQSTSSSHGESYDGVLTDCSASFIIKDDLRVFPNVASSIIDTLNALDIDVTDMEGAETRNVTFGLDEVMALLKESLISQNPLTAIVFPHSQMNLAVERPISLHQIDENVTSMNPKKIILKAMLQKSTSKLLFAQADCDFVNFIFSILVFFVGKVERFLGSTTGLKNMDNLHRSVAENFMNMEITYSGKRLLIDSIPKIFKNRNDFSQLSLFMFVDYYYVKATRMYMVSDDLTVEDLNELKISLSDVEELELQVGVEEGLSILKAALTSTTALTDGLIEPFLKKQTHQEIEPEPEPEPERSFYGV